MDKKQRSVLQIFAGFRKIEQDRDKWKMLAEEQADKLKSIEMLAEEQAGKLESIEKWKEDNVNKETTTTLLPNEIEELFEKLQQIVETVQVVSAEIKAVRKSVEDLKKTINSSNTNFFDELIEWLKTKFD